MGNCQAIDAAALVIQHPNGKIERMYWSISASEVMKINPGHYVSLIIPLPSTGAGEDNSDRKTVRFTRVKLLRPTDTLVLGRAYRLVTSHEVMKVLRAKRCAKMQRDQPVENRSSCPEPDSSNQVITDERLIRQRTGSSSLSRSKSWRPSLHSISEAAS